MHNNYYLHTHNAVVLYMCMHNNYYIHTHKTHMYTYTYSTTHSNIHTCTHIHILVETYIDTHTCSKALDNENGPCTRNLDLHRLAFHTKGRCITKLARCVANTASKRLLCIKPQRSHSLVCMPQFDHPKLYTHTSTCNHTRTSTVHCT